MTENRTRHRTHHVRGLQVLCRWALATGSGKPAAVRDAADVVPPQTGLCMLQGHAGAVREWPVAGVTRPIARCHLVPDTWKRLQAGTQATFATDCASLVCRPQH